MSAEEMESGLWGVKDHNGKWLLPNVSKSKAIAYVMIEDKHQYRTQDVRIVKKARNV